MADEGFKYAVLFRTHYWNDYLADRFAELKDSASHGDVFISYDATSSKPPEHEMVAEHSLASLANVGLYLPDKLPLWYCGDYPLYDFFLKYPSYDFYLMIENDVLLKNVNLDSIVDTIRDGDIQVLGAHFSVVDFDKPHNAAARVGFENYDVWRKCFFPVVGLTRSALVKLFAQRLSQSAQKRADPSFGLPYCETFLGSESHRQSMKEAELGSLMPMGHYGASIYRLYESVKKDERCGAWHSVFPASQYMDSILKLELRVHGADAMSGDDFLNSLRCLIADGGYSAQQVADDLLAKVLKMPHAEVLDARIREKILPALSVGFC